MAKNCSVIGCPQLIHSSRKLCNKCAGVESEKGVSVVVRTKRKSINGRWESGSKLAHREEIVGILKDLED